MAGCATEPGIRNGFTPLADAAIPDPDPSQVHYIAWVPRDQAQTAAVARALTHIALGNARERTGNELCGGTWLFNGKVTGRVEPTPARAPESSGHYPAWYYRISLLPGLAGCDSASREDLYDSLEEALPAWITLRRAAQTAPANTGMSLTRTLH